MAITQQALGFVAGTTAFVDTVNANAAVTVKASAATIYQLDLDNTNNSAASYVKLYFTNAAVTVGTTVPNDVVEVAASTRLVVPIPQGKAAANGLQVATVTAGGTAGTTSPTSSMIVRIVYA